jgi:hypothetical protein
MPVPVLIAIISGISGVTAVIVSALYARRLVRFEEKRDAAKARRDYEYEARKRLYSVYEPIRFQLVDLIGQALRRISILSLAPPVTSSLEKAAAVYELLAPAALVRMMDRNLTLADMNLEPQVAVEYGLMKAAYRVLADSSSVASSYSAVSHGDYPGVRIDGLLPYELDDAADALLGITPRDSGTANVAERPVRLMTFTQLREVLSDASAQGEHGLDAIAGLLEEFTPSRRPAFWRCLVTQVLLYGCYLDLVLRSPDIQHDRLRDLATFLRPQIDHALNSGIRLDKFWMSDEQPYQAEVDARSVRDALDCAVHYYRVRVLPAVDLGVAASRLHAETDTSAPEVKNAANPGRA